MTNFASYTALGLHTFENGNTAAAFSKETKSGVRYYYYSFRMIPIGKKSLNLETKQQQAIRELIEFISKEFNCTLEEAKGKATRLMTTMAVQLS